MIDEPIKLDQIFCRNLVKTVLMKRYEEGFKMFYAPAETANEAELEVLILDPEEIAELTCECVLMAADIKCQKLCMDKNFNNYHCSSDAGGILIEPSGVAKWGYMEGLPLFYDVIKYDLCQANSVLDFYKNTITQINPEFRIQQEQSVQSKPFTGFEMSI